MDFTRTLQNVSITSGMGKIYSSTNFTSLVCRAASSTDQANACRATLLHVKATNGGGRSPCTLAAERWLEAHASIRLESASARLVDGDACP